jgi:hypothetical protein
MSPTHRHIHCNFCQLIPTGLGLLLKRSFIGTALCLGLFFQSINCYAEGTFRTISNDGLWFGSIGGGYGTGPYVSSGFTHLSNHYGVSISYKEMWYRATYLPSDYTGFFKHNNISMLAVLAAIGGNPNDNDRIWIGIEVGPSYIYHRREVETLNPLYESEEGWPFLIFDKYLRDNITTHTIGLSLDVKSHFILASAFGMELALFGNINTCKSFFGLEFSILLGKLL